MARASTAYACPSCNFDTTTCDASTYVLEVPECAQICDGDICGAYQAPANFFTDNPDFDYTSVTDWTAVVDNAVEGAVKYYSNICGGLDRTERPRELICNTYKYDEFEFEVELELTDVTPANHEAFRQYQACPSKYRFWLETDKFLIGGDMGILADFTVEWQSERDGYMSYFLILSWKANCMPEIIYSPFA